MNSTASLGLLLIIVGGVMEGIFSLPLKFTPKWRWENIWGAGSLAALLLVPWPLAILTIPSLSTVYSESSTGAIVLAVVFGAGWGLGGIFFGLGVSAVGFSLGLSLIMGLIAAGGSLIPLVVQHPEQLTAAPGLVLIGGIALMGFGLLMIAKAGSEKAAAQSAQQPHDQARGSFRIGLLFCVLSGLLSALVNFAFIFGAPITQVAVNHGARPEAAPNAVWALVFTSNYLMNVAYCGYLLFRNRSFTPFTASGTGSYWLWALFMGVVWAGGIVVYGMGATRVGAFGAFWGFPIMLIASVLTGNVTGVLTGEWTGASSRSKTLMAGGVAVLVLAVIILTYSNQLTT